MSGANASLGNAMLQAAQLAMFDVGGDSFELMPRDTGPTAASAAAAAQTAIDDGAQLILGPVFADAVKAVKSVAAMKNINVVAFSTDRTAAGGNAYLMGFTPGSQVDRIVRFAASKNIRAAGIVAPQDPYGDAVTAAFNSAAQQARLPVGGTLRFRTGDTSVNAKLKSFADNPAAPGMVKYDAVFMPVSGQTANSIAAALSQYGLTADKTKKLGTGIWDDPAMLAMPSLQGAWFAGPSPRRYENFDAKYRSTYGTAPPRLASIAYDATALAAVLARSGKSFDRAALTNPNGFSGVDGIFRFAPDGLVERGLAVLEIRGGRAVEIDAAPTTFQR